MYVCINPLRDCDNAKVANLVIIRDTLVSR